MVGENFIRLNRKRDTRLEDALEAAKVAFTDYVRHADDENWSWDTLNRLEANAKRLDFLVEEKKFRGRQFSR